MMRVVMILVVAGVVAIGGCGRKNDPVKPVAESLGSPLLAIALGQVNFPAKRNTFLMLLPSKV